MIVEIGLALTKTLTSYLFGAYLKNHYGSIDLEGAPYWYGRENNDEICSSDFSNGGLEKLDLTKEKVVIKLNKKLENILEEVIYNNKKFKNLNTKEEKFLEALIKDKDLRNFVKRKIYYKNQKIDEDKNRVFVRGCVKKDDFIIFEKQRVKDISKNITYFKSSEAFDELENDDMNLEDKMK